MLRTSGKYKTLELLSSIFQRSRNSICALQAAIDTVLMARAIGISDIWIDSLCNIQDNEQDWRTEAASMWQVYSNAYESIVATCLRIQAPERRRGSDDSVDIEDGQDQFSILTNVKESFIAVQEPTQKPLELRNFHMRWPALN